MDLDVLAYHAQDAGYRVAEHRVAYVADVRGLVRIDRGVLDDELAGLGLRALGLRTDYMGENLGAVEEDVQIARACDLDSRDAGHRGQTFGEFGREFARILLLAGRGLDALGQIERDRESQIAEFGSGRDLRDDFARIVIELVARERDQSLFDLSVKR